MFGALIGDINGSIFEFDNYRSKEFDLFSEFMIPTDDSIMTLAIADILQKGYINDENKIIKTIKMWGRTYLHAGYGSRFYKWLISNDKDPYNSFGNGAAMRISPVAWYATSEEEVIDYATKVTKITHNHPEGIKGAIVIAMCIYYARIDKNKEFIKEYASKYYSLDLDYETLINVNEFNETCQVTVPQAIYCFLISKDFEDCIKTAISIGGDSDTIAAMAGSIAEAYYKNIPLWMKNNVFEKLPHSTRECNPNKVLTNFLKYQTHLLNK